MAKKFDESKIKRDADGKFGSGGGSGKKIIGGNNVGSTSSGKGISLSKTPKSHSDFSPEDHLEASKVLMSLSIKDQRSKEGKSLRKRAEAHYSLSGGKDFKYLELAREGSKLGLAYSPEEQSEAKKMREGEIKKEKESSKERSKSDDSHFGNSLDITHERKVSLGKSRYGS